VGKPEETDLLEDVGVDARIILKSILKKFSPGRILDSSGSVKGQVPDCCADSNEVQSSRKCRNFFTS
jgi:hypothetical protein